MKILILAASHRAESVNLKLAKLAAAHIETRGIEIDFPSYGEFDMPAYNDATATSSGVPAIAQSFGQRAREADGLILCSPEYNWSYPGSLKNILDWTSRMKPAPLAGKTALLMSATPGSRGGITGLTHLKTPLEALQMYVFPRVFPLGHALEAINDKGLAIEKHRRQFTALIDDFVTFTEKLSNPL